MKKIIKQLQEAYNLFNGVALAGNENIKRQAMALTCLEIAFNELQKAEKEAEEKEENKE